MQEHWGIRRVEEWYVIYVIYCDWCDRTAARQGLGHWSGAKKREEKKRKENKRQTANGKRQIAISMMHHLSSSTLDFSKLMINFPLFLSTLSQEYKFNSKCQDLNVRTQRMKRKRKMKMKESEAIGRLNGTKNGGSHRSHTSGRHSPNETEMWVPSWTSHTREIKIRRYKHKQRNYTGVRCKYLVHFRFILSRQVPALPRSISKCQKVSRIYQKSRYKGER